MSEELQNNQELISASAGRTSGTVSSDQNDSTETTTAELSHEVDRQRGELARVKETLSELQSSLDRLSDVINSRLLAPSSTVADGVAVVTPDVEHGEPSSTSTVYPIGKSIAKIRSQHHTHRTAFGQESQALDTAASVEPSVALHCLPR